MGLSFNIKKMTLGMKIIYSVVAVSTLALTSCSDCYLDEKM